jgi:hypothetical protein
MGEAMIILKDCGMRTHHAGGPQVGGGGQVDAAPRLHAAREADLVDARVTAERRPRVGAQPRHNVQHARRQLDRLCGALTTASRER